MKEGVGMSKRWQMAARAMAAGALLFWAGLLSGQEPANPFAGLGIPELEAGGLSAAKEAGEQKVIYVVQTGDTLWDIAKRFMNSPYYWPKIWERNTFVTNPHRIYPGDVLNLYPASEKLSPLEAAGFGPMEQAQAGILETETEVAAQEESNKVFYRGIWAAGYLDAGETQSAGSIMSNPDDKALLGTGDKVYVNVGTSLGVKDGDIFSIFRIISDIRHPNPPYHVVGHRVINLGELKITQVKENVAAAVVINSYREVQDGDRIAPYTPQLTTEISIVPNQVALEGYIVANKNDTVAMGKNEIIYIDRGAQDGVVPGNTFDVYLPCETKVDPATGQAVTLPDQLIGKLLILDARPTTSVTLALASSREFAPGDHIRMVLP